MFPTFVVFLFLSDTILSIVAAPTAQQGQPVVIKLLKVTETPPSSRQGSMASGGTGTGTSGTGTGSTRKRRRHLQRRQGPGGKENEPFGGESGQVGEGGEASGGLDKGKGLASPEPPRVLDVGKAQTRYYFEVAINTPGTRTRFKLIPDTASSDIWVLSDQLNPEFKERALSPRATSGKQRTLYKYVSSTTIDNRKYEAYFSGGMKAQADIVVDVPISIGHGDNESKELKLSSQAMALPYTLGEVNFYDGEPDGIIGFGPVSGSKITETWSIAPAEKTFIDNAFETLGLDKVFTVDYYHSEDESTIRKIGDSHITLGKCECPSPGNGAPRSMSAPFIDEPYVFSGYNGHNTKVDSGSSYITVNRELAAEYYGQTGGEQVHDQGPEAGFWYWPCETGFKEPDLHLGVEINGKWVVISKHRMLYSRDKNTKRCYGALQSHRIEDRPMANLYGVPFLQAATTCFDIGGNRLHYCTKPFPGYPKGSNTPMDWAPGKDFRPWSVISNMKAEDVWWPGRPSPTATHANDVGDTNTYTHGQQANPPGKGSGSGKQITPQGGAYSSRTGQASKPARPPTMGGDGAAEQQELDRIGQGDGTQENQQPGGRDNRQGGSKGPCGMCPEGKVCPCM